MAESSDASGDRPEATKPTADAREATHTAGDIKQRDRSRWPLTLDDLFQGVLVIVGQEGPGGRLPGVVVVPDRGGQGEDAMQHAHDDACRGVPAVAVQVELALEG